MTPDKQSDMPLTDFEAFHQEWDSRRPAKDGTCVDADFARSLERQLTSLKKDIEALPCPVFMGLDSCGKCAICQLKQKINS